MKNNWLAITLSLLALVFWFALLLQFSISIPSYIATGRTLPDALLQIISFFTIQTNLLLAIATTAILIVPQWGLGRFFNKVSVLTALAVYILIVGLVYAVVLKQIWNPQGWFKVADVLLHEFSPAAFLLFWLLFVPKQKLKWSLLLSWAIFPLAYLAYSLLRGALTGDYPYPFLNATKIGYGQALLNSGIILLLFMVIGSGLMVLKRWVGNNKTT